VLLVGPIRAVMVGYLFYRWTFMYVYISCSIPLKRKHSIHTS